MQSEGKQLMPTQFDGFPPEALEFLYELTQNNNKAWFDANKERYKRTIVAYAPAFAAALGERLKSGVSPDIVYDVRTNGAGSMMRIYRDTRFSKDKTPYKTNVAFLFWEGARKKMENPSFGFQFGDFGAGLYAGIFRFPKETLAAYRDAVVDDKMGPALEDAIVAVKRAGDYEIEGLHYKRTPRGYDADHPRAELLRHNGLHAYSPKFDIQLVTTPEIIDICYEHCRNMAPLQQWLVRLERFAKSR